MILPLVFILKKK